MIIDFKKSISQQAAHDINRLGSIFERRKDQAEYLMRRYPGAEIFGYFFINRPRGDIYPFYFFTEGVHADDEVRAHARRHVCRYPFIASFSYNEPFMAQIRRQADISGRDLENTTLADLMKEPINTVYDRFFPPLPKRKIPAITPEAVVA